MERAQYGSLDAKGVLRTNLGHSWEGVDQGFIRSREIYLYRELDKALYQRWNVVGDFRYELEEMIESEIDARQIY